jgi:dihydroxy-acid dehydratase
VRIIVFVSDESPRTGKWQSGGITSGPSRAGARAMLRAAGFDRGALDRPIVGLGQHLDRDRPCNLHLRELAAAVKDGSARPAARRWSSTPSRSPTASPWARPGMRASLVSREVIADSIELVARGNLFDALGGAGRLRQDDSRPRRWRWRVSTFPA